MLDNINPNGRKAGGSGNVVSQTFHGKHNTVCTNKIYTELRNNQVHGCKNILCIFYNLWKQSQIDVCFFRDKILSTIVS